jgi:hypothetical protein
MDAAIAQLESLSSSSSFTARDQAELTQLRVTKRALEASLQGPSPDPKRPRVTQSPPLDLVAAPGALPPPSVMTSQFLLQQGGSSARGVATCPVAMGFATLTATSEPSDEDLRAIHSVCDRRAYDALRQSAPVGPIRLVDCSRGSLVEYEDESVMEGSTVDTGQVFAFPMSPLFAWREDGPYAFNLSNWHMYELLEVIPNPALDVTQSASESFWLASCGTMFPPRLGVDVCFTQTGSHRLLLPNLPPSMVNPLNKEAFHRRRRALDDREASLSPRPRSSPSRLSRSRLPAGTYLDDSAYLSDDGADQKADAGCKALTDDDGIVRTFASPAARATRKDMKAYWRLMTDTKRLILLPDNCFDTSTWESAVDLFVDGDPPENCHPDRRSFFTARVLRETVVCTDPTLAFQARTLHWVTYDWLTLSIFHFLPNPVDFTTLDLAHGSDQSICAVLARAIEGWNLWMHAFFDHRYNQAFPQVLAWLRSENRDMLPLHSGYHLRFMIEGLFCSFHKAITAGGSPTRFDDITFQQPDAAWRLMLALDNDFVTKVVTRDPSPHPWFQRVLKARVILGCPISRNGGKSFTTPTNPPSQAPPTLAVPDALPPSSTTTKTPQPCPFHVAFLLQVSGSKGLAPPCKFQSACFNLHRPLKDFTVSAIEGGLGPVKVGPLREAILAALHDPANMSRFL